MPLVAECELSDQCCTTMFDTAKYLLDEVYRALTCCYPDPAACPLDEWRKYITFGPGNDGVDDALTVAILTAGPRQQSPTTLALALYRATFEVRLRERGWPMVHVGPGGEVYAPDWQEQTGKARQAFAHGEKMYRHLIWLNNNSALSPPGSGCRNAGMGNLIPLQPLGGVVGFSVQVTMDMPWSGG